MVRREELKGRDNSVLMRLVRRKGTVGRIMVRWSTSGHHDEKDIFPYRGQVQTAVRACACCAALMLAICQVPLAFHLSLENAHCLTALLSVCDA